MHQANIAQVVYRHLYPRRRQNDPTSFSAHVTRNLVPEVRIETATFYGALDCLEAQYPGLDYTYEPHRQRLRRFTWHRRLFRAFDELRLTDSEILSICQWEGTKSAKDKYERDAGQKIMDTTLNDIPVSSRPRSPKAELPVLGRGVVRHSQIIDDVMRHGGSMYDASDDSASESDPEESTDSSRVESIGLELNRQLLAAAEARMRGDNVVLDEQWEQWLKEVLERHGEIGSQLEPSASERLRARFQQNYANTVSRFNTTVQPTYDGSMVGSTSSTRQSALGDDDTLSNTVPVNFASAPSSAS